MDHLNQLNSDDSDKFSFIISLTNDDTNWHLHSLDFDENSSESDSLGHEIMDFCCPVDCSLVGSCNGLICLHGLTDHITPDNYDEASRIVYVRNPITKKYVTLPKLPSGDEPVYFFVIGFGYVPTTNEYKVVRMYKLKEESKFCSH